MIKSPSPVPLTTVPLLFTQTNDLYEPFAKWAGCGATVPLSGFGYRLWDGVKTAIDENGFLGLFMGGLEASAVGISGALIFGYLAALIFNPKMKK